MELTVVSFILLLINVPFKVSYILASNVVSSIKSFFTVNTIRLLISVSFFKASSKVISEVWLGSRE